MWKPNTDKYGRIVGIREQAGRKAQGHNDWLIQPLPGGVELWVRDNGAVFCLCGDNEDNEIENWYVIQVLGREVDMQAFQETVCELLNNRK